MENYLLDNEEFSDFNDFLNQTENTIKKSYTNLKKMNNSLKHTTDATPYEETQYNNIFTSIETRDRALQSYMSRLEETKAHIERVMNKIRDHMLLHTQVKQTINNQHLRSGLQGQIKQLIRNQPNSQEIISSLPEPVGDFVTSDKYVDAGPRSRTKKGGIKNKKKYTRRKTSNNVSKHYTDQKEK